MKFGIFVSLLMMIVNTGWAKITPAEGSTLNYRVIGFSVPGAKPAAKYTVEIATGYINDADSFKRRVVATYHGASEKIIGEAPAWGQRYTWRMTYAGGGNELRHFSTGMAAWVDTMKHRARVPHAAEKYKDAHVFLDGNKALFDMNGKAVWYLPAVKGVDEGDNIRDLKLTPFGTITLIDEGKQALEIDYDGNVLWKGPDNGAVSGQRDERYNHGLTRLANGHYMVIGSRDSVVQDPAQSEMLNAPKVTDATVFGTLIEYDAKGKVVWSWQSLNYLMGSDVAYRKSRNMGLKFYAHDNGFYFDEKEKAVYLSYRDISRIIKISYPDGKVIGTYGHIYTKGTWEVNNPFFCRQHSPAKTKDGKLIVFNNGCDMGTPPKVGVFEESASEPGGLKTVWEYTCDASGVYDGPQQVMWLVRGGNAEELPDGSMLICMGTQFGKTLIVSKDKKTLWSMVAEEYNAKEGKWEATSQFKADIITNAGDMERLVWGALRGE